MVKTKINNISDANEMFKCIMDQFETYLRYSKTKDYKKVKLQVVRAMKALADTMKQCVPAHRTLDTLPY